MTHVPALPSRVPRRGRRVLRQLGRWVLTAMGWTIAGNFPDRPKFVVIAAPHTSNWDFVIGLSSALALDIDAHWIGKHTIFRWPFGGLMRRLGGIPVDRGKSVGLVPQVVAQIREHEQFVVAIAPEGTRRSVDKWKSGFYHMAFQSDVPIVCGYFDYPGKTVGIGQVVTPSGDYDTDLAALREYYASFRGKRSRG